ncbi:hypothetical protein BIY23_03775 [Wolbachia pipientis]|uniref:Uncharacterized protein n=1 Tax=Wolbachia pipientis TaxID=955 RepID=A0A1E7QJ69_WOLPI|nr:hypothetical protein [Wolbachia pipientis]OEY86513.1 hypothetical protein BIY23_03775 [Wolbachia pipientis]
MVSGEGSQGLDIAALQSAREHQEAGGEKSGFGIGYGDPYSTVLDGGKWLFCLISEGLYAAYNNVFEAWISGCNLDGMWKSANMLGVKFFEKIAEHFTGGGDQEVPHYDGAGDHHYNPDDFPHADARLAHEADGLHGAHDDGYYDGRQYLSPSHSPQMYQGQDLSELDRG